MAAVQTLGRSEMLLKSSPPPCSCETRSHLAPLTLQGVLLYGPPGTGKTLLARAVAHHTDCTFIRVSGGELVQKYIGEGSRMVRELFVMARCG
jgi:SpoVK/Ycf46/Vps4 family AAA+-type ATPase